jgi:hypothetical protein
MGEKAYKPCLFHIPQRAAACKNDRRGEKERGAKKVLAFIA